MDLTTIGQIISSVGFPIVMCLLLYTYMKEQNEKHENEINKLTETINANTQILTELSTLIKMIADKEDN